MIELKNMTYATPLGEVILRDVSFKVGEGDFIGLLGKNGAGKTTLVDLMMGGRSPTSGDIKIFGQDPALSERDFFTHVSFLSQDITLKENIQVKEFFKFHSSFYDAYSLDDQARIISKFKIDLNSKIGALSTGQKRRVQIVAAIASRPKILIIDEITAVLDPDARKIFFELLTEINLQQKTAIILATNIVEDLKGKIKGVLFIKDQEIEEYSANDLDKLFLGEE